MKKFLLGLLMTTALVNQALAGAGTITIKDGGGTNRTYAVTTEAGGNFVARVVLADGTAGANLAAVSAANALKVDGSAVTQPISGTVTITDGAGVVNTIIDSGTVTAVTSITNPVTVTDGAGAVNVICDSGCSGGTQYTEDAAAAADPIGSAQNLITDSTPALEVAEGDNVAQRGTRYGHAYVVACNTGGTCDDGAGNTALAAIETATEAAQTSVATIATNSAALGATGAAVPARGVYQGVNVGGNLTGLIGCNSVVRFNTTTTGNTELVALTGAQTVRVCGYAVRTAGTAVDVRLVSGTGTACATGEATVTSDHFTTYDGIVDRSPFWQGLASPVSEALCIELSTTAQVDAVVYYTKF